MEDLNKTLGDIALAGVGLTVLAVEKATELVQIATERGGEFLEKSRAAGEEWKRSAEQKAAEAYERGKQEYLEKMSDEQLSDLRRRLADLELRRAEEARAAAETTKVIEFDPDHNDEQ